MCVCAHRKSKLLLMITTRNSTEGNEIYTASFSLREVRGY